MCWNRIIGSYVSLSNRGLIILSSNDLIIACTIAIIRKQFQKIHYHLQNHIQVPTFQKHIHHLRDQPSVWFISVLNVNYQRISPKILHKFAYKAFLVGDLSLALEDTDAVSS